jgi:hypothetical protein
MSFIAQAGQALILDKGVYDLSRNSEFAAFAFIGYKERAAAIDYIAFVDADRCTENELADLRDRFFEITRGHPVQLGLKPGWRKPNGLLCFVFERPLADPLAALIRRQTRTSGFAPGSPEGVVVSWSIDLPRRRITTHAILVSLLPPEIIPVALVFPGFDYLDALVRRYDPAPAAPELPRPLSQAEIEQQRERLEIHRRNLAHYLKLLARLGETNAPISLINNISGERRAIRAIKQTLRGAGLGVGDGPDDEEDRNER